ncbi:hypothetical protein K3729_17620 [Rhodobacteraceae bacterium S2214]|nr:hypothetical protein K3729_17620 [Rhodobacteraceae bacterium S2214]
MTEIPSHPLDRWQYRVTPVETEDAIAVGDFWLTVGDDLPVTTVTDRNGVEIGVIVGFAIDIAAAKILAGTWAAPVSHDDPVDELVRNLLWAIGGRYIWIATLGCQTRLYPDAGGQVTCVYDPEMRCAGATALSLMDDTTYDARFNKTLFDQLGVNGEGWFPAGLTAHHGLSRVLPNHYLDLQDWSVNRFQGAAFKHTDLSTDEIVDRMIAITQSQITALIDGDKMPAIALTAGYETRVLLACARPYLDKVKFVTVVGEDRHQIDSTIARQIADDMSLDHMALPRKNADTDQQELFLRRGGHCHGDSNVKFHPSVRPLAREHVFVGGLGGEIGRAFLWRDTDTAELNVSTELLVTRFGLRQSDKAAAALGAWLTELKTEIGTNGLDILDLAYIENRMGPWANVQFCADPTVVRYAPMFTYETSALMRGLPADWKRNGTLGIAMIQRLWPELSQYPYNSLGPVRDIWVKIQRVIANPAIVAKKLRQLKH